MNEHTPESPSATPPTPEGVLPPTQDEKNLALLAHLLGIFVSFLGALIIWLIKKDQSKYVADQSKEALNFQITVAIICAIGAATTFIIIGCVIVPLVVILNIVFCIIATVAASKGEWYRYPFAFRLIS